MKKYLTNVCKQLHLNLIKELLIISITNLLIIILGLTMFIMFKQVNYIVLMVTLLVIANAVIIYRYIYIKTKINLDNLTSINNAFMYFYLDINNGVEPIKAVHNMKSHCSIDLSENFNLLLDESKKDNTFAPYVRFSKKYNSILVEDLILSFYQLVNTNNKENIDNFNKKYKEYKSKVEKTNIEKYNKQFGFTTITPVIGTMVITLIVVLATVLLIRGYING